MDPIAAVALVVLFAVVGVAAAAGGYRVGYMRGLADGRAEMAPSTALFEELADLRHIKAQLEHPEGPVPEHDHIYPREPDARKLGWLRYHCVFPACPAIKWVERAPKPPVKI